MDKILLPVFLDVTGLTILLVGGGAGAGRKLEAFRGLAVVLRVVAPVLGPQAVELLAGFPGAEVFRRPVREDDLDGVSLVYVFTDDEEVNRRTAGWARARGLWCNAAGNRGPGSFTNPAAARKGGLILAVGSGDGGTDRDIAAAVAWRNRFAALWEE